jgi:hypothetical protein
MLYRIPDEEIGVLALVGMQVNDAVAQIPSENCDFWFMVNDSPIVS